MVKKSDICFVFATTILPHYCFINVYIFKFEIVIKPYLMSDNFKTIFMKSKKIVTNNAI